MEAKQYVTKQPMDHRRNQRRNQPMRHSKSSSKREVYSNTILPQETRKVPNKQPNLTPKATRERKTSDKSQLKDILQTISPVIFKIVKS